MSQNVFALSGDRKNIEFQSCYINAVNDGSTKKFANDYCRCFADKIDGQDSVVLESAFASITILKVSNTPADAFIII